MDRYLLNDRVVELIAKRLQDAAPRGVKVEVVLARDALNVDVRARLGFLRGNLIGGGGVVLDDETTAHEALVSAIEIASDGISHVRGQPWPSSRDVDNEPHLAVDVNEIRIWFGESRWPTLTLEPIPLTGLP